MMTTTEFLKHPVLTQLFHKQRAIKLEKQNVAYNLFSLSTYTAHLENFHSDVIRSLLDPLGLHNKGNLFLLMFIDYLNEFWNCSLSRTDFEEAFVDREKGRVDIAIKSRKTGKAIIIENKINNADHREGQIDDYYDYLIHAEGYSEVPVIIHLTLNGEKLPPNVRTDLRSRLRNIPAFSDKKEDVVNGWLNKCLAACNIEEVDATTLLYQYIKLIRHLSSNSMDNNNVEKFYEFLNRNVNSFEIVETILELKSRLPVFRASTFADKIKVVESPFSNCIRNKIYHYSIILENYIEGDNNYKMDVTFGDNGSAELYFWNPPRVDEDGLAALTNKLKQVSMLNEFEVVTGEFKYRKVFTISSEYKTPGDIDNAVFLFVESLLAKFKSTVQKHENNITAYGI